MNVCVALFISLFIVAQAFDVNVFLSLNCYKKEDSFLTDESIEHHLFCERFTLNSTEVKDFQTLDFVVSNEKSVVLKNCDIGTFNHNFFKKFPKAISIQFYNVTLNMIPSRIINHPLRELSIYGGNISSVEYCNAWKDLPELRTFVLGKTSGQYLVDKTIPYDFFRGNKKLQSIKIFKEKIANINPSALFNLRELKSVHLTDLELNTLPLFSHSQNLELNLSGNKFERIPGSVYLRNLKKLIMINCNIKNVTIEDFKDLNQLRYLVLDGNKIHKFEKDVFEYLPNLQYLSMVGNQLENITLKDFGRMASLETLDVEWNYLNVSNFLPEGWTNEWFHVKYLNQWSNQVKKEVGSDGQFSVVGVDVENEEYN